METSNNEVLQDNEIIEKNIDNVQEDKTTTDNDNQEVENISSVTLEDFTNLNNNYCVGTSAIILSCGLVVGCLLGLAFKGIFKK